MLVRSRAERDALVLKHLPLVSHVAKRVAGIRRLGWDDAIQEGYDALIHAAELWEEGRGRGFMSFAYVMIQRRLWNLVEQATNKPRQRNLNVVDYARLRATQEPCPVEAADDRRYARELIRAAMRRLPKTDRVLGTRRWLREQSAQSVADSLGVSRQAVELRLKFARIRLAREVARVMKERE